MANAARGEALVRAHGMELTLRPTFQALVAAEAELGPLFALVERAAAGALTLGELVALFWYCLEAPPAGWDRTRLGEGLVVEGIAAATPALGMLLRQILQGR